jgi:xanthine dehydrogenase YagR molybdenum-binding subunit
VNLIGQPMDRIDGLLKVTGEARYAAEFPEARLAHAVLVTSTIARGTITSIDASRAQALPGVLLVMTYQNAPRLPNGGKPALAPPAGRHLSLLQDNQVQYNNEPVAVVVADTLEHATDAAHQLRITYQSSAATLDFAQAKPNGHAPDRPQGRITDTQRGSFEDGMRSGTVHVDAVYTTPIEHHNPMEPHATMARWDGPQLTLYDSTQGVSGAAQAVAHTFGMAPGDVRVISPFIGGGFGCKGSSWSHVSLCAMAAKQTGRPVRLVLERPQMFGPVGARPHTEQHFTLAARHDGTLTAMRHDSISNTSMFEDWTETCCMVTRMLYTVPNQDRADESRHTDLHARARRDNRLVRARIGNGRTRRSVEDGPARAAHQELRRVRSAGKQAVVEQVLARVLSDRRGEIRLVAANRRAAFNAQRQHADRHGHGHRDLSGQP